MNAEKLRKLYCDEQINSAPNMEMLWQKIDIRLTEKEPAANANADSNIKITRSRHTIPKIITAAVACVAAIIAVPVVFFEPNSTSTDTSSVQLAEMAPAYDEFEETEECADAGSPNDAFESQKSPQPDINGSYSGESFSEENVLAETECFVDAVADRVYASNDGGTYYELSVMSYYSDTPVESQITAYSPSAYQMEEAHRYFIPLKISDGEYLTACNTAPQIEFTDSGIIYFEGWVSLDSESSRYIDDKMKITSEDALQNLIQQWQEQQ